MEIELPKPAAIGGFESKREISRGSSISYLPMGFPRFLTWDGLPLEGWIAGILGKRQKTFDTNSFWLWDDTPFLLSLGSNISIFLIV